MRTGLLIFLLLGGAAAASAEEGRPLWVTAYYPGWRQRRLPPSEIDFGALTHLAHFSVVPRADGSLDAAVNMLTPANVKAAVAAAHGAGRKILFTVGGRASRERFLAAWSDGHREAFIGALVGFMRDNGYDGIDVDMEELTPADAEGYVRFIRELRARLDGVTPRPLLTAAALWEPGLFARLARELDQINLMTYNLSGPYPGWVVWHSAPLYSGGHRFPNGKDSLPSADGLTEAFLAAGVPKDRLGVGLSFNGYVWSGGEVSRPRQAWTTPPEVKSVPYYAIARTYLAGKGGDTCPACRWDADAQAAYLSVEGSAGGRQFVSYDNEASAGGMVRYARGKGLGGLIVWDLGAGYRAEEPAGRRDPLLQAVKKARLEGRK